MMQWQKTCDNMPKNNYVFLRKAIIFTLAKNSNLFKWKKVQSATCALCGSNIQTQIHLLNNCPMAIQTGRTLGGIIQSYLPCVITY